MYLYVIYYYRKQDLDSVYYVDELVKKCKKSGYSCFILTVKADKKADIRIGH
jgi:hypothetical protein